MEICPYCNNLVSCDNGIWSEMIKQHKKDCELILDEQKILDKWSRDTPNIIKEINKCFK